jgi:phosphatidylserine/phosphatidylglycerophosphate/cardiolipin synthase-like enzyme
MRDLVGFVLLLNEIVGSHDGTTKWIAALEALGTGAFDALGVSSDVRVVAERRARELDLVDGRGLANRVRLAQLVLVADIVAAVPPTQARPVPEEPLVFTVPSEAARLIQPRQRLDLLVADVIRDSTDTLHIGGPFWNEEGFGRLRPVLEPALAIRGVRCEFFVHESGTEYDRHLRTFLADVGHSDRVTTWWYRHGHGSLMHAKFCIGDGRFGYFGSANLTSLGFSQHVEVGVKLSPAQCGQMLVLLDALIEAGLFSE